MRFENGEEEYYDFEKDPHEVESGPGSASSKTRNYWESWIEEIASSSGAECRGAEDAPPLPPRP